MALRQRFTEHPASVDETYWEHFKVATHFARSLFGAAAACAVHAVLPWCHEKTASTKVRALCDEMSAGARGRLAELDSVSAGAQESQIEAAV